MSFKSNLMQFLAGFCMQLPHKYLLLTTEKENNEKMVQISWGFFLGGRLSQKIAILIK